MARCIGKKSPELQNYRGLYLFRIWQKLDFFVSDVGALPTIESHRWTDQASFGTVANSRNERGYSCKVEAISLNDVFLEYFSDSQVDYMSVDTEGNELVTLESFDFERFAPKIVTVEHNFTEAQSKLDELFARHKYTMLYAEQSGFDTWYVRDV